MSDYLVDPLAWCASALAFGRRLSLSALRFFAAGRPPGWLSPVSSPRSAVLLLPFVERLPGFMTTLLCFRGDDVGPLFEVVPSRADAALRLRLRMLLPPSPPSRGATVLAIDDEIGLASAQDVEGSLHFPVNKTNNMLYKIKHN